jgi:hypothetical protein
MLLSAQLSIGFDSDLRLNSSVKKFARIYMLNQKPKLALWQLSLTTQTVVEEKTSILKSNLFDLTGQTPVTSADP